MSLPLPLVSVVLCTYNGEKFIAEQLESVLSQTYRNLEIILCDDASTDHTFSILESYAARDQRIKLFRNEKNIGYNQNFEKAIGLAGADHIAIADQDDIWEQNKIEAMITGWPENCDFVYSLSQDFEGSEPQRQQRKLRVRLYNGSDPHKLYFESPVHGHACMFRRRLLQQALPFPPHVYYDWWLSVVASSVSQVGCIPQVLTHHRVHPENTSRNLVRIEEKEERHQQLRRQRLQFIEALLQKPFVRDDVRKFSTRYASLLAAKKNDRFSFPLFLFFFQNSRITFYYKKSLSFFSLLRNSYKRAKTGL